MVYFRVAVVLDAILAKEHHKLDYYRFVFHLFGHQRGLFPSFTRIPDMCIQGVPLPNVGVEWGNLDNVGGYQADSYRSTIT